MSDLKNPERFFSPEEMKSPELSGENQINPQENFWLNLLLRVNLLESLITEQDRKVLKNLTKIDIIKYEDSENYLIEFFFKENEYFENEKLIVTV